MTYYFTSDEHYFHANIIKYCNRPFANADEMNEALIRSHNEVVTDHDTVYHLGDFTFRNVRNALDIVGRLNGKHIFIRGNHDEWLGNNSTEEIIRCSELLFGKKLLRIEDYLEDKINSVHLIMFHFPLLTWHKGHRGSIMLHGHTHGSIDEKNEKDGVKRFDVGVDTAYKLTGKYRPFSIREVIELSNKRANNTLDFGQ